MAKHSRGIGLPGLGAAALAVLLGVAPSTSPAATRVESKAKQSVAASSAARKGRCAALQGRAEARLQRGLRACARAAGTLATLQCNRGKRAKAVNGLVAAGCPAPAWAVDVKTVRVGDDRTAFVWQSPTNWARLLDRADEPVASSVRVAGDLFENLLLLAADVDVATVVGYVEDLEQRLAGVGGRPTRGAVGRGAFPVGSGDDRSIDQTVETAMGVIERCAAGGTSMFADGGGFGGFMRDVARAAKTMAEQNKDSGANDNDSSGDNGHLATIVVAEIIEAVFAEDESGSSPPADGGQCADTADGSCNAGGDDEEAEQSTEGSDDPEGSDGEPGSDTRSGGSGQASSGSGQAPSTGDPGPDGEGGGCANQRASIEDIMAECESQHWQTQVCRAVRQVTSGCADESLINPGPDGDQPCTGEGMSAAEYYDIQCQLRGRIAKPGPDGGIVCAAAGLPDGTRPVLEGRGDLCSDPRANVTAEMCAQQGNTDPALGDPPLPPRPDPRGGVGTAPTAR